jgi:hypothetical protein
MPWYSVRGSVDALLAGRRVGRMYLVCYLRRGDRVFETYWTTARGVEAMDYSYALMDLTVYGRQEPWEDSPPGWPQLWQVDGSNTRINGRPIAQWSRLKSGHSDDGHWLGSSIRISNELPAPRQCLVESVGLRYPGRCRNGPAASTM